MWGVLLSIVAACAQSAAPPPSPPASWPADPSALTDADWKARLSAEQYRILRQKGTERAFTGPYWDSKEEGVYLCAGCGQPLFGSADKFDSGTGWPSYTRPISPQAVRTELDGSHGMIRTEALCARCGGHLGHVFDDGPRPTGQRWCINGHALVLQPGKSASGTAPVEPPVKPAAAGGPAAR